MFLVGCFPRNPAHENMKEIGFIFLLLVFGTLPVFGQTPNDNLRGSDSQQSNFEHGKPARGVLIAQGVTAQNLDEETSEASTNQSDVTDSENGEDTIGEGFAQSEETRRIFKIINDYQLAEDEVLTTLVIIAADVKLQGRVTGNALVIGGDVQLSPEAQVNGTLHIIGGQIAGNTQGVTNLHVSNDWQMVPAAVHLLMYPHAFWGSFTDFRLTLVKFGIFLLMYLSIVVVLSQPINEVSALFARRPIGSILFGILMLVMIPLLLTLLTLSIIGVPFMLLTLSLLVPLAICGKAAIFLTLGSTLFSGRWRPLAVIFGYILYFMATSLPYIDWVAFLLVNNIAIGLCLLSGISMMRSQEPRRNTSPFPTTGGDPGRKGYG